MKTTSPSRTESAAFTMIEMIGVLAVMAILAGVIAPNVLRSIDRAAITAEAQTVHNFGSQVRKYLHDYGALPVAGTWSTDIATYAEVSPADVLTNKRQIIRVYLPDPSAPTQRIIILSSMKAGLPLPVPAAVTPAQFTQIWATQDGSVPASFAASWNGWGDYLVIERVNLTSDYRTIIIQNNSNQVGSPTAPLGTLISYKVTPLVVKAGIVLPSGTLAVGSAAKQTLTLVPNERLNLYTDSAFAVLDYTYILNTDSRNLDFDGNHWK